VTTVVSGRIPEVGIEAPEKRSPYRHVWIFFVLAALGFAAAGWFGEALPYDGAHYFLLVLEFQALWHPLQRYSSAPFEYPTLLASSFTNSLSVLRHIFGLSYAVAPFGALVASWLAVRKRAPRFMVWPALGIALAAFPGLLFPISESVIVAEWAWPLILLTMVSIDGGWSLFAAVLVSAFLLFLAANSLLIFVVVAVTAGIRAAREPASRWRMGSWAAAMLIVSAVRYFVLRADFSTNYHGITLKQIEQWSTKSYLGYPLAAYLLAICVCAVLLYLRHAHKPTHRFMQYLPTAFVAIAGLCLAVYSSTPSAWRDFNLARDITLLFQIPLFVIATIDHFVKPRSRTANAALPPGEATARVSVLLTCGLVLLLCLGLWSASWSGLTGDLVSRLDKATTYCVAPSSVTKSRTAFTSEYILGTLAIDLQGRTPAHVVISAPECRLLQDRGIVELPHFEAQADNGWFHFSTGSAITSRYGS
jgi:hypothetical protein